MGNRANTCTENRIRAKTATSVDSLEAKTTDDDTAAFMDRTDDNLMHRVNN